MSAPRSTASGQHAAPKSASSTSPKPSAAGGTSHVVVKGDTLGGIARKYGVSQDAIKKANDMTKDTVVLGKTLQIPAR
ncbi:MAG: LysM peptidoglycan-binding domain-containing protein [Luteolibacter sp.]